MTFTDSIPFLKEIADLDIESDISNKKLVLNDVWEIPNHQICSTEEAIEHFNQFGKDVSVFMQDSNSSLSLKDQFNMFLNDIDEHDYKALSEEDMFKIAASDLNKVG